MKEMMIMLAVMLLVVLVVVVIVIVKTDTVSAKSATHQIEISRAKDAIAALERRADYIGTDADDRLSRCKMEIQMLQIQSREMKRRIRRCEKELGINIKEVGDDED
jgi:uncharacterized membrane protein